MMPGIVHLFVVILATVKFTEACNGYHLKLNYARTCLDNSIVKPKNLDMSLDKDCNIVVGGCLDFEKPVKFAKATYEVTKAPMPPLTGEIDMCQLVTNSKMPQMAQLMAAFGLPKKCPVPAKKFCVNGKKSVSIANFKNQLSIGAGTTEIKLNVEHDTGKSCVEFSSTLSKKK